MNTYLFLKFLHILGVVLFVGNIVITGWWKTMAARTGDSQLLYFAQRQVTLTDYVFTALGAVLVVVTGFGMLHVGQLSMQVLWVKWGIIWFSLSGILWVAVLIPIQIKQASLARVFRESGEIPVLYWRLEKVWLVMGIVATVLPIVTLYLMVVKPV